MFSGFLSQNSGRAVSKCRASYSLKNDLEKARIWYEAPPLLVANIALCDFPSRAPNIGYISHRTEPLVTFSVLIIHCSSCRRIILQFPGLQRSLFFLGIKF